MDDFNRENETENETPQSAIHVATEGESLTGIESDEDLSPGSPSIENVAFVLLGVVVTLIVLAQFLI